MPAKGRYYNYGRIQVNVDTDAIGKLALVRVYIPNHPIDELNEQLDFSMPVTNDREAKVMATSTASKFLYHEYNEWDDLYGYRHKDSKLRKEIAKKIRQQNRGVL